MAIDFLNRESPRSSFQKAMYFFKIRAILTNTHEDIKKKLHFDSKNLFSEGFHVILRTHPTYSFLISMNTSRCTILEVHSN